MSVYDLAHQLAQAVCESEEYQLFIQAKEKIMADEASYKRVTDFQNKQWEIQQAQMYGEEISGEKQQELESLYSLLSLNAITRDYLEAEFRVSRMINDVQKILGEAIKDAVPVGFEELH